MKAKITEEINIHDVRHIIASGEVFSCTAVTLSEQRKKGGELTHFIAAKLLTAEEYGRILTGRPLTQGEKEKTGIDDFDPAVTPENPKWVYGIRHILTGPNFSEIRTIRPLLITIFNNKKVIA